MKFIRSIVAAAFTVATACCLGSIQASKEYCDGNRDKAVQNAVQTIQSTLPALVGPAVDSYLDGNNIPTVQTNTVVLKEYHTNYVTTVTDHYVVTRETNIVQNVQTNLTVNYLEEHRTVINAHDRIVSTNGNSVTTIYAQNKRIEKVNRSLVTEAVSTNLYENTQTHTMYLRDTSQLVEVKNVPGYANWYHYKIMNQPTVEILSDKNNVWRFEGVYVPITSSSNWSLVDRGVSGVSFNLGFKIQGGYLSINQDGTTNYVTATTFPAIGSVLRTYSKYGYLSNPDGVISFTGLSMNDIWVVSDDADYNMFYGYVQYGNVQTSYFNFTKVNEITLTTELTERIVDDLVGHSELPGIVAGMSANNVITNPVFKSKIERDTERIADRTLEPYLTNAVKQTNRAKSVADRVDSTLRGMTNYWDSSKSVISSAVETVSGYRYDAVNARNDSYGFKSSAEAASAAAQTSYDNTVNAANNGISQINERIAWFDQYSGKSVTVTNFNFYNPSYVIDMTNYVVNLRTMSILAPGGKNVKLKFYAPWNSFGLPSYGNIGFKEATNTNGLSIHYSDGIGGEVDVSQNTSYTHLYVDDIFWTADGYWNAMVHWTNNNISGAYGSGYYRGAGPSYPPDKHNPQAEFVEGQITLTLVSQNLSSDTYRSYLGNSFYLWRDDNDTSTSSMSNVLRFVTEDDLSRATNHLHVALDQRIALLESTVASHSSSISSHGTSIENLNAWRTEVDRRISTLEGFHEDDPDPEPTPTPLYYVYNVTRNVLGSENFGTLTVDVREPTRVSSEWNDTYFYQYAYTRTWTGSPNVTFVRKGFPKSGYTWQPWCWIEFEGSTNFQIQSRDTGTDINSFFTGSQTFTFSGVTYTITLDHIETE